MKIKTSIISAIFILTLTMSEGISCAGQAEEKQVAKQTSVSLLSKKDLYTAKISKKTQSRKASRDRKSMSQPPFSSTLRDGHGLNRLIAAIQGRSALLGKHILLSPSHITDWRFRQPDGLSPHFSDSLIPDVRQWASRTQDMERNQTAGNDVYLTGDNGQSLVFAPYKYQTRYTDGLISLSVPIPATDSLTISPVISYALYANNDKSVGKNRIIGKDAEIIYGGVNLIYLF